MRPATSPPRAKSPTPSARRMSAPNSAGSSPPVESSRSHHDVEERAAVVTPIYRRRLHLAGRTNVRYRHRARFDFTIFADDRHRLDPPRQWCDTSTKLREVAHSGNVHRPEARRNPERVRPSLENQCPFESATFKQLDRLTRKNTHTPHP